MINGAYSVDFETAHAVPTKSDDSSGLAVRFYEHVELQTLESEKQGRPIGKGYDYVEIITPGGKSIVRRRATIADQQRFPRHWAAFKAKEATPISGTPLESWPALDTTTIWELKALHILSVDQLANLSDMQCQNIRGRGLTLREKARNWLAIVAKEQPFTELQAKNKSLEEALEEQTHQVDLLKKQVESLMQMMESNKRERLFSEDRAVERSIEDEVSDLIDSDTDEEDMAKMGPKLKNKRR